MFVLFKEDQILPFKTCSGLYGYIRQLERGGKENWIFARYSYQRLVSFYQYVRSRKVASISMGAINMDERAKPDVLEILTGDIKRPRFVSITSNVDVASLQEEWCHNYCKGHGYTLRKLTSPDQLKDIAHEEIGGCHD